MESYSLIKFLEKMIGDFFQSEEWGTEKKTG